MGNRKTFELEFHCHGRASGKMRNDISVHWPGMGESFELATDEGPLHGGDGTAPPPLALFSAALAGCLMTQIRAFARRMRVPLQGVEVRARLRWRAEQEGAGPYVSAPGGFELDIELDSAAPIENQISLVQAAQKGCFIEQCLAPGVILGHRLRHGSDWINV